MDEILTPLNHREIAYDAGMLSGVSIPGSSAYKSDEARKFFDWIDQTGDRVFDDDLIMDYGMDCLRLYLLFENTPKEQDAPFYESWNEGALEGMYKFLGRYRRMVLAACAWNRQGGYRALPKDSIEKMHLAFQHTEMKMDQCIRRENRMPNRHNVVSALMELLNILYKELHIGEIVMRIRQHAIKAAVPKTACGEAVECMDFDVCNDSNEAVTQLCREFVMLMAPIARDLSKILWQWIAQAT